MKKASNTTNGIMIILFWFSQCILRKSEIIKTFVYVVFYFIILFILDYIFVFAISLITKTNTNYITENMSNLRIAVGLSSKTTLFIIINLLDNIILKSKENSKKSDYIIIFFTITMTVVSTIMYTNLIDNKEVYSEDFLFMCFVVLLIMILAIFMIINFVRHEEKQKHEILLIEQQNNLLKKNLKEQEELFLSWKRSIHDYKNRMIALEGLLKSNNYDEALRNVETEVELFRDKAFYISTGNITIDILLNNKMNIANEFGISFTFNVSIGEEMKISDIHFSSVLGNLIDNAIEAVQDEEIKNVHVQINSFNGKQIIKVLNTYTRELITDKSSKIDCEMHGIGLKSVRKIVDDYQGNFSIKHENGYVTALIVV